MYPYDNFFYGYDINENRFCQNSISGKNSCLLLKLFLFFPASMKTTENSKFLPTEYNRGPE